MKKDEIKKAIKETMELLQNVDCIDKYTRKSSQINVNKAYNILEKIYKEK